MRMESIHIEPKQRFFNDYQQAFERVAEQFEYNPHEEGIYHERLSYLQNQTYQREALADVLNEMNAKWEAPASTFENVEKLRDPQSTVVIAGQQAGLLGGPLYTVHKAISVLQLAKKQEKDLGTPVIPVFWIAGEDHDFDEINHVFMKESNRMKKLSINQRPESKLSVSDLEMDQHQAEEWMKKVFSAVEETEFTSDLYKQCLVELEKSVSYSDFFARLMYWLLPQSGLVIVDAHSPEIRALESSYFTSMIERNEQIAQGVYASLQKNKQAGYETLLDSEIEDAHLFYHHEGDRILLVRDEEGHFKGKNDEVFVSEQELLRAAKDHPRCLSNNVVTRPLMQECLFPVLAFIGGPGEINYWSALKPGFSSLGLQMPPVLARLSFTLIDRKSNQTLERLNIDGKHAIQSGVSEEKMNWIASQSTPPIDRLSEQVKQEMDKIHKPLRDKAADLGPDLESVAEKNFVYIKQHIDYLEKRFQQSLEQKFQREIEQFDELQWLLHPNGGLQERVWNLLPWVNQYGPDLFERINDHMLSFDQPHYIVYM